jgi:catechol 2,3-dioxygenase-like lactoylglutathione lyase family enzyme
MFSHVGVGASDLQRSAAFYDALLIPLGLVRRQVTPDGGPGAACWVVPYRALPRFYVYLPYDRQPARAGNGVMVSFAAPSPEAVTNAHHAATKAGGECDGPPGPRERYGAGYFGAYLRDPDGNKIHVVHRGDLVAYLY